MTIKIVALLSKSDKANHPEEDLIDKKNPSFSNASVKKISHNFFIVHPIKIN